MRPQDSGYNPTAINKDGFISLISGMLMRDAHLQHLLQVKVHRTSHNQRICNKTPSAQEHLTGRGRYRLGMHRIFGHRRFSAKNCPKVHFRFSAKILYHRNNTAETEICDDADKNRGQHTLVWISANMSAVWTFFNVSENVPHIAICKNCNALILMKLVHSHSHKCNVLGLYYRV